MINRGRLQAQGDDLEKSEHWATDSIVTKIDGNVMLENLKDQLTRAELSARSLALQKAKRMIDNAPPAGIQGQIKKSYYNSPQNREIRIDVEINAGTAFVTLNN